MSQPLVLTNAIVPPEPVQVPDPVIEMTADLGAMRKSALVFQPVEALLPGLADPLPFCA